MGIEYVPVYDEHGDDVGGYTESVPDHPENEEPPEQEPTLAELLAWTAEGTFGEEAAVWLLDQHGHWLPELDRCGLIGEQPMAVGDIATIIRWRDIRHPCLIGTDSEMQVLAIAHSLARADAATVFKGLTSLDEPNRRLVLHAIAWAMGGRTWANTLHLTPPTGGWEGGRSNGPQTGPWADESPF